MLKFKVLAKKNEYNKIRINIFVYVNKG